MKNSNTKNAASNCHSIFLFGIFTGIPCHLKLLKLTLSYLINNY